MKVTLGPVSAIISRLGYKGDASVDLRPSAKYSTGLNVLAEKLVGQSQMGVLSDPLEI